MSNFIAFAAVGSAIIASMGLAMWLEWFCLRWLMRIMPGQSGAAQSSVVEMTSSEEAESVTIEPAQAKPEMPAAPPANATQYEVRLGI